jgi:hypothetical protein
MAKKTRKKSKTKKNPTATSPVIAALTASHVSRTVFAYPDL